MIKNAFYAQSGGVTPVINATACGVIETAKRYPNHIHKVYAGKNGIMGALQEELIDTYAESNENIRALLHTPGGAFGSCRYKLKSFTENRAEYERLIEVFKAHNIGYFFYNGGGDSQDTANKIAEFSKQQQFPLTCIGIPKTIDNDLPLTDNCPGFGSVAKYVAVSIREAGLDVASMCSSSTKVFILEVMGRHAGWIAAAGGLRMNRNRMLRILFYFPKLLLMKRYSCAKVKQCVEQFGYCAIVASEGIKGKDGKFLSESGLKDAFGHEQLGGVAPKLAHIVKEKLGYKYHWAVSDYLQRAARHIASQVDVDQAYALGKAAVELAVAGENAVLPIIVREADHPYKWRINTAQLSEVANVERKMPREYMTEDGFGITEACRQYLLPLIQGEAYPPYVNGLPNYARLKNVMVKKLLD